MKVLTAGVKSSNKKSKKKKSSNNNTKQQQQSHSTSLDTANNNDIESAAAAESSSNTFDNRLNTPNNLNGGHSIVGKFFIINVWLCFVCVLQNQPYNIDACMCFMHNGARGG